MKETSVQKNQLDFMIWGYFRDQTGIKNFPLWSSVENLREIGPVVVEIFYPGDEKKYTFEKSQKIGKYFLTKIRNESLFCMKRSKLMTIPQSQSKVPASYNFPSFSSTLSAFLFLNFRSVFVILHWQTFKIWHPFTRWKHGIMPSFSKISTVDQC